MLLLEQGVVVAAARRSGHGVADGRLQLRHRAREPRADLVGGDLGLDGRDRPGGLRPELDPDRAFEWSPALFSARAAVLEDLGRTDEAAFWTERADVAASALGLDGQFDEMIVEDGLIEDFDEDYDDDSEPGDAGDAEDAEAPESVELADTPEAETATISDDASADVPEDGADRESGSEA